MDYIFGGFDKLLDRQFPEVPPEALIIQPEVEPPLLYTPQHQSLYKKTMV